MTNDSYFPFHTSEVLFCSSVFLSPSFPFLSPSLLTPPYLHAITSLSPLPLPLLSLSFSLSAAPPSCLITHGPCLKKREREGRRGQMGGETASAKERVGDRVRVKEKMRAAGWVWGTWPVNERSLLPLSASSFSHCLLSLVGLLLRKNLVFGYSSSSPSLLFPLSSTSLPSLPLYLSLRETPALFSSQVSRLSLSPFTPLSPASPSPLPSGCRVRRLSSTKRGCRPWR